jgi:hypothetical protein
MVPDKSPNRRRQKALNLLAQSYAPTDFRTADIHKRSGNDVFAKLVDVSARQPSFQFIQRRNLKTGSIQNT